MPKHTDRILEARRYFVENTVLKAFEENRCKPQRLQKRITQIVDELAFTYGHSESAIWLWLRQYKKETKQKVK